jgi:nucleoside-diphosphate-sugar epimerase
VNVLMIGHKGYIGSVMVTLFKSAGHRVVGLDTNLFDGCTFGDCLAEIPAKRVDLRDVQGIDLEGFDALVHLAALSNAETSCVVTGTDSRIQPAKDR